MAQREPSSGTHFRPHRSLYGHFPVRTMPESTAAAFLTGYPVMLDAVSTSTHRIGEMTTLAANIVGIAGERASSVQDTQIPVYLAYPGVEFRGVLKGVALESSHMGAIRSVAKDTTLNIYYVDGNTGVSTAGGLVEITDVTLPGNDIGDTNAEVGFVFAQKVTAFNHTLTVASSIS